MLFCCLLVAVFAIVSKGGTCPQDPIVCPEIPSATVMCHGFDALKGLGGLNPVVTWTYDLPPIQTWTSPASNITYKIPDQLSLSLANQGGDAIVAKMSSTASDVFEEYISMFSFSAGFNFGNAFGLAFNYVKELYYAQQELKEQVRVSGWSQWWVTYYQLDAPPGYAMTLSKMFRLALAGLPQTIKSAADSNRYREFVTAYGTHYLCIARFGGYVHQMGMLNKSTVEKFSYQMSAHEFALLFHFVFFDFDSGGFKKKTDIHFDSWFDQDVAQYNFWSGGARDLSPNGTSKSWVNSIPDNPQAVNATLCPISDLVDDPTKQDTLWNYIKKYLS